MRKKSFSVILPTVNAFAELKLCLVSLKENSRLKNELIVIVDRQKNGKINQRVIEVLKKNSITYIENLNNLGPYGSWNKGAKLAKKEILCFITDDQYFAPGWDKGLLKFMKKNYLISGQLVEPGVLRPSFKTILKDFGENADNFKTKNFLKFAKSIKKNKLVNGIFFIPLAIYKDDFFKLGKFSAKGEFGVNSVANDVFFVKKAIKHGYKFKTSLACISYHFQACSWEKRRKFRKLKNKIKIKIINFFGIKTRYENSIN